MRGVFRLIVFMWVLREVVGVVGKGHWCAGSGGGGMNWDGNEDGRRRRGAVVMMVVVVVMVARRLGMGYWCAGSGGGGMNWEGNEDGRRRRVMMMMVWMVVMGMMVLIGIWVVEMGSRSLGSLDELVEQLVQEVHTGRGFFGFLSGHRGFVVLDWCLGLHDRSRQFGDTGILSQRRGQERRQGSSESNEGLHFRALRVGIPDFTCVIRRYWEGREEIDLLAVAKTKQRARGGARSHIRRELEGRERDVSFPATRVCAAKIEASNSSPFVMNACALFLLFMAYILHCHGSHIQTTLGAPVETGTLLGCVDRFVGCCVLLLHSRHATHVWASIHFT